VEKTICAKNECMTRQAAKENSKYVKNCFVGKPVAK
jgi:hypothetical protein